MVLVTGGAGYIGSHTAKALRLAGYRVVIFDNLSAGHRGATLGAPLIVGDIRDVEAVRCAIRESGAAAVIHFAARLLVAESMDDPAGYYDNNVRGTLATLEAMNAERCRLFVFSSTCAVYGEPTQVPLVESHPAVPINPYGQTKLAIEQALPHYERAYGMRSICLRYFNAAGADPDGELGEDHQPEIHAIPRAFDAAAGGRRSTSSARTTRRRTGRACAIMSMSPTSPTPTFARFDGWRRAARRRPTTSGRNSLHPCARCLRLSSGSSGGAYPIDRRRGGPGDPAVLYASAARIRADLGWAPARGALDTIVGDAWRWHSRHPGGFEAQAS